LPAFFLVAVGIMFIGKWPNGQPPAWDAGEARPWPSGADARAARQAAKGGAPALAGAGADVAPAPVRPASSGKRRRKRGGR
jgi:hypothetical protein